MNLTNDHVETLMDCAALAGGLGVLGFVAARWRTAGPSQFLVKTGLGVRSSRGMAIGRWFVAWPGQRLRAVDLTPTSLHFNLKCLSKEYLPFSIPVTYTVRCHDPFDSRTYQFKDTHGQNHELSSEDLARNYAERMVELETSAFHDTVLGVVHGETRVQAARMTIDSMNDNREQFRETVVDAVQSVLYQFGLHIDNANMAELLEDEREGSMGYLKARERKKLAEAVQQANVDVTEREAEARKAMAILQAEARMAEVEQEKLVAIKEAELRRTQEEARRTTEVAVVVATAARDLRREELERQVQFERARQEEERCRAEHLSVARVKAECAELEAKAQAVLVERAGAAERSRLESVAAGTRTMLEAEAAGKLAELAAVANGELQLLQARAEGARQLVQACAAHPAALPLVLGVQHRVPQEVAAEVARAVRDMQPKIVSVTGDSPAAALAGMVGGIAPMIGDLMKVWQGAGSPAGRETSRAICPTVASAATDAGDKRGTP